MEQDLILETRASAASQAAAAPRQSPILRREVFQTSRLIEFCNRRELVAQTGHQVEQWPLVVLKELLDNSIDACEDANTAPEIAVNVSTASGEISVSDNGPGMAPETIAAIIDYRVRVSSREAYCSPCRGAQGNALKTLLTMPFAIDGQNGEVQIETRGLVHHIRFSVDHIRQEPRITLASEPGSVKNGTRVTLMWPNSACSILEDARSRFLQIIDGFAWLNPHLRITAIWDGRLAAGGHPSVTTWEKWRGWRQTSAYWYDMARFERYIAAHVARDEERGQSRLVREFIGELRGLSGTAKQKAVLDATGMARTSLRALFAEDGSPRQEEIARLLWACREHSRPVKPQALGLIGRDHLLMRFRDYGVHEKTFKYQAAAGVSGNGLPWVVEAAFGFCPERLDRRRFVTGVNFSVGIGNPFRSFGGYGQEGLETLLAEQRATEDEPIAFVLHYVCPRTEHTDRGKTAIVIPGASR